MTGKYAHLVETYRTQPDRIRAAVFSMTCSQYTPPIHAFVVLDGQGKETERITIDDIPLNDTEKQILALKNAMGVQWQRVASAHTNLLPYIPKDKKGRYKRLRQEPEIIWDEGYLLLCEMASCTSLPNNQVMMARLTQRPLGVQDLKEAQQLVQDMKVRVDVYESRVERFLNKHPPGLESVMGGL